MKLEGFAFTEAGWVQSYGSRYVRPPIIHGDVVRKGPMTIKEFEYAQSLTKLPVKGMLTGAPRPPARPLQARQQANLTRRPARRAADARLQSVCGQSGTPAAAARPQHCHYGVSVQRRRR